MACATLKRSLDWETINQISPKRRRFSSMRDTSSPNKPGCSSELMNEPKISAFAESDFKRLIPEKLAQNINAQKSRKRRREQFTSNDFERMQDSESSGSEMSAEIDSPRSMTSSPRNPRNTEKGLFTYKEVQMICERMLKEQEDNLREQYDAVLTTKLAEQYDVFVKFTYDQIQKRYDSATAPSYLS